MVKNQDSKMQSTKSPQTFMEVQKLGERKNILKKFKIQQCVKKERHFPIRTQQIIPTDIMEEIERQQRDNERRGRDINRKQRLDEAKAKKLEKKMKKASRRKARKVKFTNGDSGLDGSMSDLNFSGASISDTEKVMKDPSQTHRQKRSPENVHSFEKQNSMEKKIFEQLKDIFQTDPSSRPKSINTENKKNNINWIAVVDPEEEVTECSEAHQESLPYCSLTPSKMDDLPDKYESVGNFCTDAETVNDIERKFSPEQTFLNAEVGGRQAKTELVMPAKVDDSTYGGLKSIWDLIETSVPQNSHVDNSIPKMLQSTWLEAERPQQGTDTQSGVIKAAVSVTKAASFPGAMLKRPDCNSSHHHHINLLNIIDKRINLLKEMCKNDPKIVNHTSPIHNCHIVNVANACTDEHLLGMKFDRTLDEHSQRSLSLNFQGPNSGSIRAETTVGKYNIFPCDIKKDINIAPLKTSTLNKLKIPSSSLACPMTDSRVFQQLLKSSLPPVEAKNSLTTSLLPVEAKNSLTTSLLPVEAKNSLATSLTPTKVNLDCGEPVASNNVATLGCIQKDIKISPLATSTPKLNPPPGLNCPMTDHSLLNSSLPVEAKSSFTTSLKPAEISSNCGEPVASNNLNTIPHLNLKERTKQHQLVQLFLLIGDLQTKIMALASTIKHIDPLYSFLAETCNFTENTGTPTKELSFEQIEEILDKILSKSAKCGKRKKENTYSNLTTQNAFRTEDCTRNQECQKSLSNIKQSNILQRLPVFHSAEPKNSCIRKDHKNVFNDKKDNNIELKDVSSGKCSGNKQLSLLKNLASEPIEENWSEGITTDLKQSLSHTKNSGEEFSTHTIINGRFSQRADAADQGPAALAHSVRKPVRELSDWLKSDTACSTPSAKNLQSARGRNGLSKPTWVPSKLPCTSQELEHELLSEKRHEEVVDALSGLNTTDVSQHTNQACSSKPQKPTKRASKPYAYAISILSELRNIQSSQFDFRLPPHSQRPALSVSKRMPKITDHFE